MTTNSENYKTKQTLPDGFKPTELGPLPEEWEVVRLGDYCELLSGFAFKSTDFVDTGILVVKIGNLQNGTLKIDNRTSYFPETKVTDKLKKYILKTGDILIAMTGATTGKVAVVPNEFENSLLNQRVGKFNITSNELDQTFFRFCSLTEKFQEKVLGNILKSAQGNVSPKQIENIKIPLPPLSEQKAIAAVLSAVQQAKEKTGQVIEATRQLKKSMMKHLFTYGPVPLEEAEKVKLKDTEIGEISEEWEVKKLVEFAKIIMGQSPPGSTYNINSKGKPFLQGKAEFGFLHPKHIKYTTKPLKLAKKGSVLLSVRAPVGDVNLADQEYCIGRGLSSISSIEGDNIFLFYLLHYFKSKIESEGTGSTFKAINKSKLENFKFPLPPLSTQQKIAEILSAIDNKIEAEENKKKAMEELFKSLLSQLMTGKIRVKNLKEEL